VTWFLLDTSFKTPFYLIEINKLIVYFRSFINCSVQLLDLEFPIRKFTSTEMMMKMKQ
jgi:hypothetical protein